MSNTYYLPNEEGWANTGGNHYLRFKVVQTYNASTNKSSLVITLQGKSPNWAYTLKHYFGAISANDTEVLSGSASDQSMEFGRDSTWRNLKLDGVDVMWTVSVTHNADGSASVPFQLGSTVTGASGFQLSGGSYNAVWGIKTATLALSEQRGNIRIGVGGAVKRGQTYIGINGVPKIAELYIGVNGVPKRCI